MAVKGNISDGPCWEIQFGSAPLVATAIHDGHTVRREIETLLAVSESDRLHEEDPNTSFWTTAAPTRIVGLRSRFEFDLNRPRDKAVYVSPDDAWGLNIWHDTPSEEIVSASLVQYDAFYQHVHTTLSNLVSRFGRVLVLDLHSYNYKREGEDGPPADPKDNPELNIGTGTMDRGRWAATVDRFISELSQFDYEGRSLDVRENIKFRGGHFPEWIHTTFPESVCCLSVEVKKFFMDEWTAEVDQTQLYDIGEAIKSAAMPALEEMFGA